MEQYIKKSAIVAEIKDLYENIDKCIGDLILARSKHDQHGISDAHWKMETLMVNTQQVLSYILDTLETKEVDLEKELDKYTTDNFWALDGNNESPYLLEKDDMLKVAKYFYELGLKTQKGGISYDK